MSARLHHVTALARDASRTVRFYRDLLGFNLEARTSNPDDPATEMLIFGHAGGARLSFLVYPRCQKAAAGYGAVARVRLQAPERTFLEWTGKIPRCRAVDGALLFRDPDGLPLSLVEGKAPGIDFAGIEVLCRSLNSSLRFWLDELGAGDQIVLEEACEPGRLGYGGVHHLALERSSLEGIHGGSPEVPREGYRSVYLYSPEDLLCEVVTLTR